MTISRNLSFLAEGVSSTGVLGATYGGTGQSSITTGDLLYGSASNTISKLAIGSTGTVLRVFAGVPSWGTDYTGTVTSVSALTLGTTGTDLSSTVANGTTTPVITLNVPTASATNRGVLSSTDWTTFNNKGSGSVTSVAATVPSFLSISGSPITTSGTLAITYSGTALPIANGGTAQTSFTTGQVLYGSFSQSANLFYDGTNLGLGTNTPNSPAGSTQTTFHINNSTAGTSPGVHFTNGDTGSAGGNGTVLFMGNAGGGGATSFNIYNQASSPIIFYTATTEKMRVFSSGGVSIGNTTDPGAGNLRFNTTGTNGIYFGASSLLNDYETGTWTPNQGSGFTVVGSFTSNGTYTKIGNIVTVRGYYQGGSSLAVTAGGTMSSNLPFTSSSSSNSAGSLYTVAPNGAGSVGVTNGVTTVYSPTALSCVAITFAITYQV